jgi:hypothetical protein
MILTFVGNKKHLTNKELKEIKKLSYLNSFNVSEISVELKKNRTDWNKRLEANIKRIKRI